MDTSEALRVLNERWKMDHDEPSGEGVDRPFIHVWQANADGYELDIAAQIDLTAVESIVELPYGKADGLREILADIRDALIHQQIETDESSGDPEADLIAMLARGEI